ncbi:MAG: ADP-ribosylglycohydrolase family protein [Chloroflexi bacterium]|nr:ADP-ribosylglycohydrolase family protein [Chloroflexota bacterium]MBP8055276.1 ADP-ribosylglycohydrolase family protein [Chloroflexota bacterium]
MKQQDRFRGCLLGLAVGDAVGTTVEFSPRGSFTPLTDMVGGGPFHLQAGQWTDDTSMALCLATSLVEKRGFEAHDQMNRYVDWYKHGYLSSTGRCFDIGNTTRAALHQFQQTGDPFSGSTDPRAAGNGSLMRLAPVPLFYYPDREKMRYYAAESSRTTHAAAACLDACRLFAELLYLALAGADKETLLTGSDPDIVTEPAIRVMATGSYRQKTVAQIRGSGYVVDSLEAALWCFAQTDSYEAAVLAAANLGDDADTTAAICGQIAGAYYGLPGIPERWLVPLTLRQEITTLADQLQQH